MALSLHDEECHESYHRGLFHENNLCCRHRCLTWEQTIAQESKRIHTGSDLKTSIIVGEEDKAATKIQAVQRGKNVRKLGK
jgi:hypothetical protein